MNPSLGAAIDQAVKEQYPNGNKPTFLQKEHKQSEKDRWVNHFILQLQSVGLSAQREFRFHPVRMWRLDFAFVGDKIGIEIDGGGFGRVVICDKCHVPVMRTLKEGRKVAVREGGRHNTGAGMEADAEKNNAAIALGWRVLHFTSKHIRDKSAIALVESLMKK